MSDQELSGAELARLFSAEAVEPLLARAMPRLRYATGRLGSGSDVLGLDDAMSRDHDWGCRLTLLVDEPDRQALPTISDLLERELPERYRQFPVRFPVTWDVSVSHKVDLATVGDFAASRLGVDPTEGLSVLDWLVLTGQSVLEVTAGPVFTDRTATLAPLRQTLRWYPPDVERYALAAGWNRLAQRMPMLGRTAERGDELGSRLLSAQLAQDLVGLAFTLSRQWQPYAKWRGALLRAVPVADRILGLLETASTGPDWRERETALADAAEVLLDRQRVRGLPAPASAVTRFWDRPYRTIGQTVSEAVLRASPTHRSPGCRPASGRSSSGSTASMSFPARSVDSLLKPHIEPSLLPDKGTRAGHIGDICVHGYWGAGGGSGPADACGGPGTHRPAGAYGR